MTPHAFDLVAQRARLHPDRPAVSFRERRYTWGELEARTASLARRLASAGVGPGDRVALVSSTHVAHLDLLFAAARLGAAAAPLDPRLAPAERERLLALIDPAAVLVDPETPESTAATASMVPSTVPCVPIEAPGGQGDTGAGRSSSSPAAGASAKPKPDPLANPPANPSAGPSAELFAALDGPRPDPDAALMLLATSGSRGAPRLAEIPVRQIAFNALATVAAWDLGPGDATVHATSSAHAGFHALVTPVLAAGGFVVLLERFDPRSYLDATAAAGATVGFLVPSMLREVADAARDRPDALRSLRWIVAGGAPLPDAVRAAWSTTGVPLRQGYGLTEAGVNCFMTAATDDAARARRDPGRRPVGADGASVAQSSDDTVGVAMLGTEAVVRDDAGAPCAPGEVGELTLRGPHLFSGYVGEPDASRHALRDGWLWTGDLASQDARGRVTLRGRRRDLYISGGLNVFPADVEAEIAAHPDVDACAVIGVPDERWGEAGVAFVTPREARRLDPDAVAAFLRDRLAGYKVPRRILVLDELPRTPSGKPSKPALRAALERGDLDRRTPDVAS